MIKDLHSDFYLLDEYLLGNKDSGRCLFENVYLIVWRYVFSHTSKDTVLNTQDKENIISETMLRVTQNLKYYNGKSAFSTYAIGYAKFVRLEFLKQNSQIRKLESTGVDELEKVLDITQIINFGENPADTVIRWEQQEMLNKALDMLKPEHKDVLILRCINGMSFNDIATVTEESLSAVHSRFRRAIVILSGEYKKLANISTDF